MGPLRELGSSLVVGALIVGVLAAIGGALARTERERPRREKRTRAVLRGILGSGAALTLAATLLTFGAPAPERYVSFDVVRDLAAIVESFPSWGETTQLVINLVLLSWLAFSVPLLWPRWGVRGTVLLSLGAAMLIEVAQWLIRTGRAATLTDVLINSLGAALVAVVTVRWVRPRLESRVRRPGEVSAPETAASV